MSDVPSKPSIQNIWANSAGAGNISNPGASYIEAGWPLSATPPPRQFFNWILNWLMNGVRYLSRAGISDWDSAEQYVIGDIVRDPVNVSLYQSLQTGGVNVAPHTNSTYWGPVQVVAPFSQSDSSTSVANTGWVTAKLAGYALTSGTYSGLSVGNATNAANANFATSANSANSVPWTGVSGKPTTVAGFGITDAFTTAGGTINGQTFVNSNILIPNGAGFYYNAGTNTIQSHSDGTNVLFGMPGNLYVNGQIVATENWVSGNFLTPGTANATYLSIAAAASTYAQLGSFGSSLGSTGYQRLPGGFIMQWGYATTPGGIGAITTVTFPVTFPNACLAAFCNTGLRNSQGSQGTNFVTGFGASFLQVLFDSIVNASGFTGGYWLAIGH